MASYIVAPLELSAELLGMPKNTAYSIVIKLKDPAKANEVRNRLMEKLGTGLTMKTKAEENAAFENDQHRETNDLFNLRVGNFYYNFQPCRSHYHYSA